FLSRHPSILPLLRVLHLMPTTEDVACLLSSDPSLWWGHHPVHGWVVLDRSDARNRLPDRRCLVRCSDWSLVTVPRVEFSSPDFSWCRRHLASLPAADTEAACSEWLALHADFTTRRQSFRVSEEGPAAWLAEVRRAKERWRPVPRVDVDQGMLVPV